MIALWSMAVSAALAGGGGPTMTKVVLRDATPGVDPRSFAASPRTVYRVGDKKLRLEERPNPATGLHLLSVSDAPHAWLADLASKTVQHVVDPAPDGVVRFPVVAVPGRRELTEGL